MSERTPEELAALEDVRQARAALDELEAEAHAESERAIEHHDRPPAPMIWTGDGLQTLGKLEADTPDEHVAAAGAVADARERARRLAFWDELGGFERELAARAFGAGARSHARRLAAAIGTASATVDGPTLRKMNDRYRPAPLPDLVAVANEARRFAAAEHGRPATLRLADVERVLEELVARLREHHVAEDDGEAADVGEELELVDRLRGTIDELEAGLNRAVVAASGIDLEGARP